MGNWCIIPLRHRNGYLLQLIMIVLLLQRLALLSCPSEKKCVRGQSQETEEEEQYEGDFGGGRLR